MATINVKPDAPSLAGSSGNDLYLVAVASDYVSADTLDGGAGIDEIRFTSTTPNDTLHLFAANTGIERVVIGGVKAPISSGKVALNIDASAYLSSLTIIGNAGTNQLTGTSLSDTLDGGVGIDTLNGGDGDDTYVVDNLLDTLIDSSGIDTIKTSLNNYILSTDFENLILTGAAKIGTGNAGANLLKGNALANTLNGGAGDDTLDGGASIDLLIGGAGNDTYIVDNAADKISEFSGEGTDLVKSTVSYSLEDTDGKSATHGGNVENLVLIGSKAINGSGSADVNEIIGNNANNVIDGKAGVDLLDGAAGNDVYLIAKSTDHPDAEITDGGGSQDEVRFSSIIQNDTLKLYAGDKGIEQVVIGTGIAKVAVTTGKQALNVDASEITNALIIIGNAGANNLLGTAQNDTINGGAGNDTLDGGVGNDSLAGGVGNDTYLLDSSSDIVTEAKNAGIDTVRVTFSGYVLATNVENLVLDGSADLNDSGNTLANLLTGNIGNNLLDGDAGNDTLIGGAGSDTLTAGAGNDMLDGGMGDDVINGGAGIDTVLYSGSSIGYEISKQEDGSYKIVGSKGTDILDGVEFAKFGNAKAVSLASLAGIGISEIDGIATVDNGSAKWGTTMLKYSFMNAVPTYDEQRHNETAFRVLTIPEQNAVTSALQSYLNVSNLTFELVADTDDSTSVDLRYGAETMAKTLLGYAFRPESGVADALAGDVWLNKAALTKQGVDTDSYMYTTIVHETGHALGLKHTGNYGPIDQPPYLPESLDSQLYSIMSYNLTPHNYVFRMVGNGIGGDANTLVITPSTPMLFDVAAIQSMYGANMDYHSGDDSYNFDQRIAFYECLWDGGGVDTINTASYTRNSIIDLREGHFSSLGYGKFLVSSSTSFAIDEIKNMGLDKAQEDFFKGFLSKYADLAYNGENNLSIAYGAVIENAIGGKGNDVLRGNSVANLLTAGNGDDTLAGGAGDDTLNGDNGSDQLYGGEGKDQLAAGADADTLDGGDGSDTLLGGLGSDLFVFSSALSASDNVDTITDFNPVEDMIELDADVFSAFTAVGKLAVSAFASGGFSVAQDVDDRIIFDTITGALYYDGDGTGADAAIQFASLINLPSLSATDFLIV